VSDILSQGVLQRISLVRGLAPGPLFVLFDEANSAIDGTGDAELRNILEGIKAKTGLILISHRPSLLKMADEFYELKNGQLSRAAPKPAPTAPGATGAGQ
jgi:ATP-binding cassette subfamily C protein LapB